MVSDHLQETRRVVVEGKILLLRRKFSFNVQGNSRTGQDRSFSGLPDAATWQKTPSTPYLSIFLDPNSFASLGLDAKLVPDFGHSLHAVVQRPQGDGYLNVR